MTHKKSHRILHLIDTTGHGGAEKVLLYIVENLESSYKSFIVLPDKGWLYHKISQLTGVEVTIINGNGKANFSYIYNLIKYIKKNKIDLLHSHLLGTSLYASITGLIYRKPVICTFHGFIDADLKDPLLKFKFSIIKFGSKAIVSVSEHLKDFIVEIVGKKIKKCITIYNGIPLDHSIRPDNQPNDRKQFGLNKEDVIIGAVGNIKPAKGYIYLIRAAKIINNINPRCKFIIAGTAEGALFEELIELRNELSLKDTIKFIGYQEDIDKVYRMMDMFVLSSTTEGFSLATIEAMIRGIPVIVTKSGGPQEIVKDNFSGLIVNIEDEHALAEAITYYFDNPSKKKLFAENAHKTAREKFSLYSMITAYEELYCKVTRSPNE